jgi:hypothetical protein
MRLRALLSVDGWHTHVLHSLRCAKHELQHAGRGSGTPLSWSARTVPALTLCACSRMESQLWPLLLSALCFNSCQYFLVRSQVRISCLQITIGRTIHL